MRPFIACMRRAWQTARPTLVIACPLSFHPQYCAADASCVAGIEGKMGTERAPQVTNGLSIRKRTTSLSMNSGCRFVSNQSFEMIRIRVNNHIKRNKTNNNMFRICKFILFRNN